MPPLTARVDSIRAADPRSPRWSEAVGARGAGFGCGQRLANCRMLREHPTCSRGPRIPLSRANICPAFRAQSYITGQLCTIQAEKSTRNGGAKMRVFGLLRVSKETNGNSLAGQRQAIEAEAALRGWDVVAWYEETVSGSGRKDRPELERALAGLEAGEADALVVSKLDRLTRSMLQFAGLMERAKRQGWRVVALNVNVDTATPAGKMLVNNVMSAAEFEREMIAERTRDALRVRRAEGKPISRATVPPDVAKRIKRAHRRGSSLATIARTLNRDGIPTARGGKEWHRSTVRTVLQRA